MCVWTFTYYRYDHCDGVRGDANPDDTHEKRYHFEFGVFAAIRKTYPENECNWPLEQIDTCIHVMRYLVWCVGNIG